jgi:pantetheine-phosphate adenylyltransferase
MSHHLSVSPKNAFYAGSFDPLTNGHLSIVHKAVELFDTLVIGVGYNPKKTQFLPISTRLAIINQSIADSDILTTEQKNRITVMSFSDIYQVSAAVQHGCGTLLRGLRNTKDFEEESLLATVNETLYKDLNLPQLQTHLFHAEADKVGISSSMVRAMIGFTGWETALKRYVPAATLNALIAHYNGNLNKD